MFVACVTHVLAVILSDRLKYNMIQLLIYVLFFLSFSLSLTLNFPRHGTTKTKCMLNMVLHVHIKPNRIWMHGCMD